MNYKGSDKNSCPKSGIKIHNKPPFITEQRKTSQLNNSQLNKPVSFQNTPMNELDLDLENYSLEDLYHLFNIDREIYIKNNLYSLPPDDLIWW